jgi:cell division septum initiation protein DivIVA
MRGWSIRERVRDLIPTHEGGYAADESYPDIGYQGLEPDHGLPRARREPPSIDEVNPFIDEIEEMICSASKVPLTSKALVDQDRCLATLDVLRANWPLEVLEAQRVLAKEGEVLERAEMEAEEIKRRAERQAGLILDQNQLVKVAEVRAQEVIESAQQEAARIRERARQDARDVYEGLEHELDSLMRDVRDLVSARLKRLRD